jgi:hypothetical protein
MLGWVEVSNDKLVVYETLNPLLQLPMIWLDPKSIIFYGK